MAVLCKGFLFKILGRWLHFFNASCGESRMAQPALGGLAQAGVGPGDLRRSLPASTLL